MNPYTDHATENISEHLDNNLDCEEFTGEVPEITPDFSPTHEELGGDYGDETELPF